MSDKDQIPIDLRARFNFRDLGGVPTRDGRRIARGRLYRGASLHELDAEELERFRSLGVGTVIDLRTRLEFEHPEYPPLRSLETHNLPLFEDLPTLSDGPDEVSEKMAALYMSLLEVGRSGIASSLALLAEPERYPVAFFCSAGKDRTGVLAAIVLAIAGVADEEIARDYARTDASMDAQLSWIAENDPDRWDKSVPHGVYRAHARTMRLFLAQVEEHYGGLDAYVREIGVAEETTAAIARNLFS